MCVYRKYTQKLLPQQAKRSGKVLLTSIITFTSVLFAMENNGRGAKAIGMANAFVAFADNIWAIDYNPAGLTRLHRIEASAFVIPEQFGLAELRTGALGIAIPLSFATMGCTIEQFGFDLFKETEWRTGVGIKVDRSVSIGASLNLHYLEILKYGFSRCASLDGGILAQVSERISMGFNLQNIVQTILGSMGDRYSQVAAFGVCWFPIRI